MRRRAVALVGWAMVLAAACGGGGGATTAADPLVDIGAGLRGVPGLRATVYASGLVHAAAFATDDEHRLWVATAAFQDDGTDTVMMVPSGGATPTTVLSGLHTPLGLLWRSGVLYVAAKGGVEAYERFDGTSFGAHHTVLALAADVGEVNGLEMGPDGRLLLGVSAPCDHCVPASPSSAAILSFLPDGTDLQVFASAIRAPIALAFFPGTPDLFVTMNHRDDLGAATPGDWLALVRKGDAWGFPDCYGQVIAACAAVPQPVAVLDPHAALSGLAIVTGQLGPAIGDAAVVAEWATGSVRRVTLTRTGRAYTGAVQPFVEGLKNPVAVTRGADGTVLLSDWTTGIVYAIAAAG